SRPLHVTKECSAYQGQPGQYCTIVSSSLGAIRVGSKVFYFEAATGDGLDSDIALYAGPATLRWGTSCFPPTREWSRFEAEAVTSGASAQASSSRRTARTRTSGTGTGHTATAGTATSCGIRGTGEGTGRPVPLRLCVPRASPALEVG